jgi:hypothetical protein
MSLLACSCSLVNTNVYKNGTLPDLQTMNGFVIWLQNEKCHLSKIITFAPTVFLHVPLAPSNFRLAVFTKINKPRPYIFIDETTFEVDLYIVLLRSAYFTLITLTSLQTSA